MKDHIYRAAYYDSGVQREISRCYPGTREAALKTISDWTANPISHCLWLHGPAGTGKSAIAYAAAEQCRLNGTLGASYFFSRGSSDRPSLFFPTLAYQLMLAVPDLRGPLLEALCEDPTFHDRSMSEQLDKLIVQPFLRVANRPACTVIVIDGLDECDCINGATIQGNIAQLILGLGKHSLPLRFVVSSRPTHKIQRVFNSSTHSLLTRLPLSKVLHPDRNIRHFLCKELGRLHKEYVEDGTLVTPAAPSSEAIDQLVRKSSGLFIYASTVIKFVQDEHATPMEWLNEVLQIPNEPTRPSTFAQPITFQELDKLYLHILRKAGNPVELPRILSAVIHFGNKALTSNLDAIFSPQTGYALC
ncbi:hypothetical protein BD779DRAFT_318286 [Infundibulicybe gibba]|nr:hypothetical protein BD779DRAFT_318286 [Infundibulicybe gibba]